MIFIVGVGRSGTSLLQSMLNAHPNMTSTPETHFLRKYVFPNIRTDCIVEKKDFLDLIKNDDSFKRLSIPAEEILTDEKEEQVNVLSFYLNMFEKYVDDSYRRLWVDKDPKNIEHISELKLLFPKAKIIHIYRDPRDVVASKMKAEWSSNRPYWLHAIIGECQIENGRKKAFEYLDEKHYFEIKYEDLLKKTEIVLKELSDFIGVAYDENMMSFSKSSKELVNKKELQWKKETFQPLIKNNSNKWKQNLSVWQASYVENASPHYFNKLKYQRGARDNINTIQKSLLFLSSLFNRLVGLLYKILILRR